MSHFNGNEQGIRRSGAANPNMAGVMTYGGSPASGPAPTTAGHHKHDILNKLDPRVDSTQDRRPMPPPEQHGHVPAGTYGPHSSRIANILDPRVDSDMGHRGAGAGAGAAGAGVGVGATQGYQQPAMHGAAMGTGTGAGTGAGGVPEGTYGPHRSRIANALDPRVDSDMDGSRNPHHNNQYDHGGGFPTGAAAPGAAAPGYGPGPGVTSVGQHRGYDDGYTQQPVMHGAAAGGGPHAGGHRHGGVGNTMNDPTVDPAMSGPGGPAPNTAGPHRSDLLNRLDPRVDSKTGMKAERRDI